jgi:hypothetical protein
MSQPPLKTVRTTFMVYGLAPAVSLRARTKRSFPFRQLHSAFPVDSLRVRWVPLVRSFRRLGAFALGQMPRVHGFPVRRLLRPLRHFLRHWSFVRVSLTYFPPSFASSESFPCSPCKTPTDRVRWCVPIVPSTLCGFPAYAQGRSRFPWATIRMTLDVSYYGPTLNGGAVDFGLLADISGKVCQGLYSP